MIYKDFLTSPMVSPYIEQLRAKYPQLMSYLGYKYANFELLYPIDVMLNQYSALFNEYQNVLLNIEDALKIRNTQGNTLDNLGETNKRSKKVVYTSEGSDSTNYLGYNVIGEYEKKNDTLSTNNDTTDKVNTYNFLSALTRLETETTRLGWFKFERAFVKLFITLYPVQW